jgi:hypothetical protein
MTPALAEWMRKLHPLRLQYEMLSDTNPFAPALAALADTVRKNRSPAAPSNPFLIAQETASKQIVGALESWGKLRDSISESVFLSVYGSPMVQAAAGVDPASEQPLRKAPKSSLHSELLQTRIAELKVRIEEGGLLECAIRGLLYAGSARRRVDERGVNALRRIHEAQPKLTLSQFKAMAREQFYLLLLDEEATIEAIPHMLPADMSQRQKAFDAIRDVLAASEELRGETAERLLRIQRLFGLEIKEPATVSRLDQAEPATKTPKAKGAPVTRPSSTEISGNGRSTRHEHH